MEAPDNLKYTKDHEWVKLEDGDVVVVGITDHAQSQLGDIVYVELPKVGEDVAKEDAFGVVESVKAVSDCYAPIAGKITEVNTLLSDNPETVNEDCYNEGWLIKIKVSNKKDIDSLMTPEQYKKFVDEEATA